MEEQLHEVNKKIKQIQGIINRRKQKASEWNLDYRKVIQEKQDKSFYLQKNCQSRLNFKQIKVQNCQEIKKQLVKKANQSRLKIHTHYNELKDLDILQKQKNKIRLLTLQKKQQKDKQNAVKVQKINSLNRAPKQIQKVAKNENSQVLCRTIKDRVNPFKSVKAAEFIDIFQQLKNSGESLGPKLMKKYSVGLQTTPLGVYLKKQQKNDDLFKKHETQKKINNKMSKTTFGQQFSQAFHSKQKIFGGTYNPRNIFQDRMRKIIKYHGDFWKNQLIIN